jgi:putative transposase
MPYIARTHQLTQALLYHICNRANGRNEIYHDTQDYQRFVDIVSNYAKNHHFSVYHWVIMPNHYHLLLEIDEPENLSSIMSGLARSYVWYYHRKYKSSGHLWQGRFKSQPIDKDTYLLSCGRYIERNPVNANMVKSAEDYPYSSANYYISGKEDKLTAADPLFDTFGHNTDQRRQAYKEYLERFDSESQIDEEVFKNLESPLGSQEFLKRLVMEKGQYLPRRQGRPRK